MEISIEHAKMNVDDMHKQLVEIAESVVKKYSEPIDNIVKKLSKSIDAYSNEDLRILLISLGVETYNLSAHKEDAELRESCAVAIYKEATSRSFNSNQGTVEARKNQSVIDTMDSQAVSILYQSVSGMLSAKLDEAHRLANILNGILISRASDAKLAYNPRSEENLHDKAILQQINPYGTYV